MRVLAFDTALAACSAALFDGDRPLAQQEAAMPRGQAERLMPMIEAVRDAAGVALAEVDLICVTVGPGTFTGVRIGIAAARGLALATGASVLGLTTCEAIAANVASFGAAPILVAMDARRDEVYAQAFGPGPAALGPPVLRSRDDIADIAPPAGGLIVGSAARQVLPLLPAARLADASMLPSAARFGRFAAGRFADARPGAELAPLYLRAPDARLPGAD